MEISSVASLIDQLYAGSSSQTGLASLGDPVAAALGRASRRIDQQLESTRVQLSAYGQIKAGFAAVQTASKALSGIEQTASINEVKNVVMGFVDAYNKTAKTVSATTQSGGTQAGALAGDVRARVAGNDLRRSAADDNTLAELKTVGIIQNKDGTLAFDTKTLENAYQTNPTQVLGALADIGGQIEKTAMRELARTGNVGSSVNALDNRSRNLEAQQTAQQNQMAAAQRLLDQQMARLNLNGAFVSGVEAYRRTFLA